METLSEYLSEIRRQLKLSLAEVSSRSGIAKKFLEYLEAGNFQKLPPDVYVLGFLRRLSEIYAVPAATLVAQFKKERGIVQQVRTPASGAQSRLRQWFGSLTVTPKLLTLVGGILAVIVVLGYFLFQISSIAAAPRLVVSEPADGAVITSSSVVVVGSTTPGSTVTINQNSVLVDNNGNFRAAISLVPGPQDLQIVAQSKFSKITTKRLRIIVNQPAGADASAASTQAQFTLRLQFAAQGKFSATVDGKDLAEQTVAAGSSVTLAAAKEILLSSGDAGNIKIYLNDKPLGTFGKKGQVLTDVRFTPQSAQLLDSAGKAKAK